MIWLTWRQFRAQGITALAMLAAAAIAFLVTGLGMPHPYPPALAACPGLDNCDEAFGDFEATYMPAFELIQLLMTATSALIGIFWGAPLLGRELETGTYQLAWT